ncbi:MAG TPA: PQQ-binding-like beta-propeller repeat protein, partial [Planctomycetota bacterium]|nr:PQQ-binding-like beta-propeller repeat protein [Planctomycetota bacterium]
DGTRLALGTFGGYLRVFDTRTGEPIFEKRFPGTVVKRVALAADHTRVYAGELSYDGFVRALDLATGDELWRFRLADELDTSLPARPDDLFAIYAYPQVICMRALGDDLIVDGMHSWKPAPDTPGRHLSRLYRFDGKSGRLRWRFPADAPLGRNILRFDVSGPSLAFILHQWETPAPDDPVPQSAVMLLDAATGAPLDTHVFRPLEPFFTTAPLWYGLALDDAGDLAVGLMDGRAAIFHVDRSTGGSGKLRVVRRFDLAVPIEVSGVPIYAGAGWAAASGSLLFVCTDGRLTAPSAGGKKSVHADHPGSNTVFVFDGPTGELLWQWKLTTTAQSVAAGANVLAAATQQAYAPDDPMDYGVTVLDVAAPGPPVQKLLYRYRTAGPVVALDVSPDGKTVAVVEAPVKLADTVTVVGKYRLHILR